MADREPRPRIDTAAIRSAVDTIRLAEHFGCKVERSGARHVACCPVHTERTPSFEIHADHYHCYGCRWHGDVIALVMQLEHLDFPEAVAWLQRFAGMTPGPAPVAHAPRPEADRAPDDDWQPILPIPADALASRPTAWLDRDAGSQRKFSHLHAYQDAQGRDLFYAARIPGLKGKVRYLSYCRSALEDRSAWKWRLGHPPPRPLFRLAEFTAAPADAPVLVVEGEKKADAAARMLPGWAVVSSVGGAGNSHHADWSPLAGRRVVLWADHDVPGLGYAADVAQHLAALTPATSLVRLDHRRLGDELPEGWDAADAEAEGLAEQVRALIADDTALLAAPTWIERAHGKRTARILLVPYRTGLSAHFRPVGKGKTGGEPFDLVAVDQPDLDRQLADLGLRLPGSTPPPDDPTDPTAPADAGGRLPWAHLDVRLLEARWSISTAGVLPLHRTSHGIEAQWNSRASDRPLWPVREGRDLCVDPHDIWWELAWVCPDGSIGSQWMREESIKRGDDLIALPGGPVTQSKRGACAEWLGCALAACRATRAEIATRTGWVGLNGSRRWLWPAKADATAPLYIGPDLRLADTDDARTAWRAGVDRLVALGADGYCALACLGASAGAPLGRLAGKRNPILGLCARTSRGKGSALSYACSLWGAPDALMVSAGSTYKGLQDRGTAIPDLPLWADDLQQLLDVPDNMKSLHDVLFYLGNGYRRVTSTKAKTADGGERRWGVGLYASEATLLPALRAGAIARVIELTTAPCPDQATSLLLQECSHHAGAWSRPLSDLLAREKPAVLADRLAVRTAALRAEAEAATDQGTPPYTGDDYSAVAVIGCGLRLLSRVLGTALPADEVEAWLLAALASQRETAEDRETAALRSIVSYVLGIAGWQAHDGRGRTTDGGRDLGAEAEHWYCVTPDGHLAWKQIEPLRQADPTFDGTEQPEQQRRLVALEINLSHPKVMERCRAYGSERQVRALWDQRGWLAREGKRPQVKKFFRGVLVGRIERLTPAAIEVLHA